ncbi:hypothetical protein NQ036_05700 [Brevibacterium sp. 91QC2O2]|uniref:ribosome maturation factor RimP n=1 Tax=Brevibacterium sp. 91QC2O2 TaxID=2968458 RepID=UPI00211B9573|nr:hypothetical protein [Brevibacterium sp. 91QC2O2]MCQ9367743.1 hypothetical protein [Brevibacterium sp. 91QC2O2]
MADDVEVVRGAIAGPLAEAGLFLEEVSVHAAGPGPTLEVVVDLDTEEAEPTSFADVERATRIVSELTDGLELFGARPYDLQVSSPGAERPLSTPRHYRRVIGRTIQLDTAEQRYTGELAGVEDDGAGSATLVFTGARAGTDLRPGKGPKVPDPLRLALGDVHGAHVLVKFK